MRCIAFEHMGLAMNDHLSVASALLHPVKVDVFLGDASKAGRALGWTSKTSLVSMSTEMVDAESPAYARKPETQIFVRAR